jgi:hypothetical protein
LTGFANTSSRFASESVLWLASLAFIAVSACGRGNGPSPREDLSQGAAKQASAATFTATVILVDKLKDPRASVMIVRRPNANPAEIIVLQSDRATAGTLGAGIQGLVKSRREHGEIPPRELAFAIPQEVVPKSWDSTSLRNDASREIDDLRRSPLRDIPGFGLVHAREIQLAPGPSR